MKTNRCSYCGASLKRYWHRVTPGLVRVLVQCYKKVSEEGKNRFSMKDLKLDHSEYGNFQKLRFHALIAKHKIDGEVVKREWLITKRGADFLKGLIEIPVKVQTFRNRVIDHDADLIKIRDVMKSEPYWEEDFEYDIFEPTQTKMAY